MGAFTRTHDFHGQLGVTDPPPDQGGVKDQCLHKSVPGPPQDLILFRLTHPSGRVGAAVDGKAFVITVNKKA